VPAICRRDHVRARGGGQFLLRRDARPVDAVVISVPSGCTVEIARAFALSWIVRPVIFRLPPVWVSWRTQRIRAGGRVGVAAQLLCHSLAAAAAERSVFMLANSRLPRRVDGQVDGGPVNDDCVGIWPSQIWRSR
jgi:hypothetical protein